MGLLSGLRLHTRALTPGLQGPAFSKHPHWRYASVSRATSSTMLVVVQCRSAFVIKGINKTGEERQEPTQRHTSIVLWISRYEYLTTSVVRPPLHTALQVISNTTGHRREGQMLLEHIPTDRHEIYNSGTTEYKHEAHSCRAV